MSLRGSLEAEVADDGVHLTYQVENVNVEVVPLTFRSGQRYDMRVTEVGASAPLWRASEGRMYTMAIEHHTLETGDTWTFEETITDLPDGAYDAHAELQAEEVSAPADTSFTIE